MELQPRETKTVTICLSANDLAFVGYDGKWILEEGDFNLMIDNLTAKITCDATYKWNSANK